MVGEFIFVEEHGSGLAKFLARLSKCVWFERKKNTPQLKNMNFEILTMHRPIALRINGTCLFLFWGRHRKVMKKGTSWHFERWLWQSISLLTKKRMDRQTIYLFCIFLTLLGWFQCPYHAVAQARCNSQHTSKLQFALKQVFLVASLD